MNNRSIVIAGLIVLGVVVVPLVLKSRSTASTPVQASIPNQPNAALAVQSEQPLPRFLDLGMTNCAPCKVMLGVMEELERTYPGSFEIEFVDVREKPDEARKYGIQTIPTQIFLAPDGRELFRHVGVFRTEEVIAKWAELGYSFKPSAGN